MKPRHRPPVSFLILATLGFACLSAFATRDAASQGGERTPGAGSGLNLAPAAGGFGTAGQWVFSLTDPQEWPFRLSKTEGSDWYVLLQPSADKFIAPNVSVGGLVKFEKNNGTTDFGLGARAGYDVKLTDLVSLWVRGGLFWHRYSVNNGPSGSQTFLDIKVPALFHLVPHFFLGGGPFIALPLQGEGANTTFGLTAIVGGYL